ncbi:hypothetical protein BV133_3230 [Blastochloris viridis]|uniref:Uncharacterized protein n=1 Tax=Blastochloris viridis TaxID=1079 RepID=A0A182D6P4_BLAVI|nr:hypothetical protein BV133_3230 [Blastochloris viridis]
MIDQVRTRPMLSHLCSWTGHIPREATFSRALAGFADSELPSQLHAA